MSRNRNVAKMTLGLALLAGALSSNPAAAASWSDFMPSFPNFPCPDGWMGCQVNGTRVEPGLREAGDGTPSPADLRVGWFDLEPTATFSPFVKLTEYSGTDPNPSDDGVAAVEPAPAPDAAPAPDPEPVAVAPAPPPKPVIDPDAEAKKARAAAEAKAQAEKEAMAQKSAKEDAERAAKVKKEKEEAEKKAKAEQDKIQKEKEAALAAAKDEESRKKAEAEAKRKEEEAKKKAEEEKKKAEEKAKKEAEEAEKKRKADEEAAKKKAAEDAKKAEEEAKKKAEEEKKKQEEIAKKEAEEAAKKKAADDAKKAEEDKRKAEEAAKVKPAPGPAPAPATASGGDDSCDNMIALEPVAVLGKLTPGQAQCLDGAYGAASKQTDKEKVSLLLMANAFGKGDTKEWEKLVKRHLDEVNRADPDLCYKYSMHLQKKGVSGSNGCIKWADVALENRAVWTGDTYVSRVYSLYKLKATCAQSLWQKAEEEYAAMPGDDLKKKVDDQRNTVKVYSREWYEYAKTSGKDSSKALQMCTSAAGTQEYCESGK